MKRKPLLIFVMLAGLLALAGYGLYALGLQRGQGIGAAAPGGGSSAGIRATEKGASGTPDSATAAAPKGAAQGEDATRRHIEAGLKAGDIDPVTGKKILYYQDPMVPASKFDKPAKSPFMDMMLWPVFEGGGSDSGTVTVSPRIQQSLGVRTAVVTQGTLSPQVSTVGSIAFNERDQVVVQARSSGFVEQLHVRATLDPVVRGRPLVSLYVPEWIAAQEEFLSVRGMRGTDLAVLVDGARQRMRQVGMSEEQIRLVETRGKTQPRVTVAAPISGVVVELMVREGMTVAAGATLFRINGLATVWANAEVPESQSALLRPGARVQAKSPAVPGTTFEGKVQAILPDVNAATRTLKARVELANPEARLAPGMFVQMQFPDVRPEKGLLVPTEAVIQTGKRSVVLLAEENGRFRPVEVELGVESGGQIQIQRGLEAGQKVVVSSQFLIDSEASLKGVEARLNGVPVELAASGTAAAPVASSAAAGSSARHAAEGRVESVAKGEVTLSHGPIPSLKWGAMTMDFKLPPTGVPGNVKAGDRVAFEFFIDPEGLPQLTSVAPLGSASKGAAAPATGAKP